MTKLTRLSLVAAVAVAGLTNVNAASLEEAIKGVDVSGQFQFRAQDKNSTTAGVSTSNNGTDVEIEVGVKVPVTDNVTAVFKIDNANDDYDAVTKGGVAIEDYYFSYANEGTTVNFGQQNIPGRMTDGAQGDGIVALQKVGAFTVGAAAFMTNSVTSGDDVYSVMAMGNVGPVSLLGQYATLPDVMDAYNVKADAKIGMVNVGAEYTSKDLEGSSLEYSTAKLSAAAKMDALSASLLYVETGKNGSGSIDETNDAAAETILWYSGSGKKADLSAFKIDASYALNSKTSLRAAYLGGDYGTASTDLKETVVQVSYKAASNLNTYLRLGQFEDGATEQDAGRVEVKYTF